jgi:PDZ domain-containing secreted protein
MLSKDKNYTLLTAPRDVVKGVSTRWVSVLALIIVLVLSFLAVAYFRWLPSQKAELSGVCVVDDYFEGDAEEVELRIVTTTIGNTTTYFTEWSTISTPTPTLTASSTFTTEATSNFTTAFTLTITSIDLSAAPVGVWFVTVCAFTS